MTHILCENCMADDAKTVRYGPELGNQRDSYQDKLQLCIPCGKALLDHDLFTFHERFTLTRTIQNGRKA